MAKDIITTQGLINQINQLEEANYKLEQDIRNFGKRKRLNDKEIAALKNELIKAYEAEKK